MVRLYCCKVFSDLMYFEGSKVRLFFELRVIFGDFLNDKLGRLGGIGGLRGLGVGYFSGLGRFYRRLFFAHPSLILRCSYSVSISKVKGSCKRNIFCCSHLLFDNYLLSLQK